MKKRLFFLGLTASIMLLASCSKDDMELLRHPYRVQGELSPSLRLPVISNGQMNLNQLLQAFDGSFSGNLEVNDTTIVFLYEDYFHDSVEVGGLASKTTPRPTAVKGGRIPRTVGEAMVSVDTTISYTMPIDLFDRADMQSIVQANISINRLLLDLTANIYGTCPPNVEQSVRNYVTARFDNLNIDYVGHDGVNYHYDGMPNVSVTIDNIIDGGQLDLTGDNNLNLASIIDKLPSSMTFSFTLHLIVDEGFVDENTQDIAHISQFHELLDSLNMTTLFYDAHMKVRLPFEVSMDDLTFSYPLTLSSSESEGNNGSILDQIDTMLNSILGEGAASIDSSKVTAYLVLQNGIPLNFNISGTLEDANDNELCTLLTDEFVPSAQTLPTLTPGVSKADPEHPGIAVIEIPLTVGQLEHLANASTLRLDLGMSTSGIGHKRVSPNDYLKISLQIKLDANIVIDMELLEQSPEDILNGLPVIGKIINKLF